MELHNLYYKYLNRPAEKKVLDKFYNNCLNLSVLETELSRSVEH